MGMTDVAYARMCMTKNTSKGQEMAYRREELIWSKESGNEAIKRLILTSGA